MAKVPAVVAKRLISTVPKYQKILLGAQNRDVNEADTVVIVGDVLADVFGFDKYTEITREYAIKSTFCDLAIKRDEKIDLLVEVKAIGYALKESHLRQAVNYAAHAGVRWIVLTNGVHWQVHRIDVKGKVKNEKFIDFDFLSINARKTEDQEQLFTMCRRALEKNVISEVYEYKQSVNREVIGALLQSEQVAVVVRRLLRKIKPGLRVTADEVMDIISQSVLRRDLTQSDEAVAVTKRISRILKAKHRTKS